MAKHILAYWLPAAFIICCFCGLIYLTVQQDYRQSANDPQVQIAEDAAKKLASGSSIKDIVPAGSIDIAESLAPYVVAFDSSGKPIAGSGILDNALPSLPPGIFDSVRTSAGANAGAGEDRFTWEPRPGVRSAVVVRSVNGTNGGFVMAGRSLREIENREEKLGLQVLAGFFFTLICSFIITAWSFRSFGKKII